MKILNQSDKNIVIAGVHIEPGKTGSIKKELFASLMSDFTIKTMVQDGLLLLVRQDDENDEKEKSLESEKADPRKAGKNQ